jgi:hypothetical protein
MWKRVLLGLFPGLLGIPAGPLMAGEHSWFHHHGDEIAWVDQAVTKYRVEFRTQVVPVEVTKVVSKVVDEPYSYTELVPVTVPEKRTVTSFKCEPKQVPYTYTVDVPVVIPEKRTITTCQTVAKQVPYTYTVQVPVIIPEKRTVTTLVSVPEEVVREVPVHKLTLVIVTDPCTGHHHLQLAHVNECKTVKSTVVHKVPVTKEILVNFTSFKTEERKGTRTVYESVPVTKEVIVNVTSHKPEVRTGTKTVLEKVAQTQEIAVNVTKYETVQKTGIKHRLVCETVKETVNVTRTHKELVPFTAVVKVPVRVSKCCE